MALFNEKIPRRAILGAMMFLAGMFFNVIYINLHKTLNFMVKERFKWNQHIQKLYSGIWGYFYGVVLASVPAGFLAERYGGSKVVAFATLIPAVLNLLIPWVASIHYDFAFALCFVMGFFGSAVYPALNAMVARWVPPGEKGMFIWTMEASELFGNLVTIVLCNAIISAYGWMYAFYVTSGLTFVFWALWVYLIYDTPDLHPNITEKEKTYIKEQIGTSVSKQKVQLPVKSVATSLPFLILLWAHFAHMWGFYFIATYGSECTLEVLGFKTKLDGAITELHNIIRQGAGVLFAAAGDYVRRKNFLSLTRIRKIFMLFSHLGPAGCLIVIIYVGCNGTTAIVMLILALAFNGAACQTSLQNHQDLAPNYAGSLFGIMTIFGSFSGFIFHPSIDALTTNGYGVETWCIMIRLSALMFISATVLFWLFGSGEIQPWNNSIHTNLPTVSELQLQIYGTTNDGVDTETEENERL